MRVLVRSILVLSFSLMAYACADKNEGAQVFLDEAKSLYEQGKYDESKSMIDSIKKVYPKALPQIKEGVSLLKEVRIGKNKMLITMSDSLLVIHEAKLESLKKGFIYTINKAYQDQGVYLPKGTPTTNEATYLRSGVAADGLPFLESVYAGAGMHNQIAVKTKDGLSAESLTVTDDGLNFRFSNLGKQYEVIKFIPAHQNGVVEFISSNVEKPIILTLKGKNAYSYTLSSTQKKDVAKSLELSVAMLQVDSLKSVKEKAAILLNHVTGK